MIPLDVGRLITEGVIENERIEYKKGWNPEKILHTICAFANDIPGSRKKGYLLIGVHDDGSISGLKVDDVLMKKISGIRSDGNILPLPVMNTGGIRSFGQLKRYLQTT